MTSKANSQLSTLNAQPIPLGYKQTEVGVIPEDWEAKSLGDIAYVKTGTRNNKNKIEDGAYPFFVRSANVERISTYSHECEAILVPGEGQIGNIFHYINGRFDVHQRVYTITQFSNGISGRYVHLYMSQHFGGWAMQNTVKATVDSLRLPAFQTFEILLPPTLEEQTAIATALSDMDALLNGLDRLIAKKRALKQATMQQLLTGKSRLPGFEEDWEAKSLGDIAYVKTGTRNNKNKIEDGAYPFFVRSANVERISTYSHECEAILVPGEGQIGNIFHYINGRFDVHQRVYTITQFSNGISGRYVHLYMSQHFGGWAMQNTVKATVDSLRLPAFQTFEILLPPTLEEQTAIATVLSDIDTEIDALEQRRNKTKDIKQAMMQELLTGKTRLI